MSTAAYQFMLLKNISTTYGSVIEANAKNQVVTSCKVMIDSTYEERKELFTS